MNNDKNIITIISIIFKPADDRILWNNNNNMHVDCYTKSCSKKSNYLLINIVQGYDSFRFSNLN